MSDSSKDKPEIVDAPVEKVARDAEVISKDELLAKNIEIEKAKKALWKKGVLHWKLDSNQKEMYKFAKEKEGKIIVIGSSRQLGKSYFLVTLALEQCLRHPNSVVKYVAPKLKEVKRIVGQRIREITEDCPEAVKPHFRSSEHTYRFKNGSEIQLAGSDNGHAESIRGTTANLCIIDEAGFCDDLDYIVKSILIPTTTATGGKIIMSSTPSRAPDHDFMKFMEAAELDGRFIRRTIYDNPRMTETMINELAEPLGGKDSVDFRREYMVEKITSEDDAVVPEFNKDLQSRVVKEWVRPPYYDSYVSMDIGVADLTVVLFAYWDFRNAKLIVEDEHVVNGKRMLTDSLAAEIKNKEKTLWYNKYDGEPKPPLLRISDNNNLILLNDLAAKHSLAFATTLKDNKAAALNNMRMMLKGEHIIIHPRCRTLILHLEGAIWNRERTKYARSGDKGHYDAVDALVYMCRNLNQTKNPYPAHYNFAGKQSVFYADDVSATAPTNAFERGLTNMSKIRPIRGSNWRK